MSGRPDPPHTSAQPPTDPDESDRTGRAEGTPTPPAVRDGSEAGNVVAGKYKLLETLGEGGMGTVWMAQQTEPVKRLVAVKLIRAGQDSKTVHWRGSRRSVRVGVG